MITPRGRVAQPRLVLTNGDFVARTKGFFYPHIETGKHFKKLTDIEQRAVIAHEKGHIHHKHMLRRLFMALSLRWIAWDGFLDEVHKQELEADAYAVGQGHAAGLCLALMRSGHSLLHPSIQERIFHIHTIMGDSNG